MKFRKALELNLKSILVFLLDPRCYELFLLGQTSCFTSSGYNIYNS